MKVFPDISNEGWFLSAEADVLIGVAYSHVSTPLLINFIINKVGHIFDDLKVNPLETISFILEFVLKNTLLVQMIVQLAACVLFFILDVTGYRKTEVSSKTEPAGMLDDFALAVNSFPYKFGSYSITYADSYDGNSLYAWLLRFDRLLENVNLLVEVMNSIVHIFI